MPQDNGYDDTTVAAAAAKILSTKPTRSNSEARGIGRVSAWGTGASVSQGYRSDPPATTPREPGSGSLEHAGSMLRRELNEERAAHSLTRRCLDGLRTQVNELEAILQAAREKHSLVAGNQARRIAELEQENAILRGIRSAPDQGDIELVDF